MDSYHLLFALCDGTTSGLIPKKLLLNHNKENAIIIIILLLEGGSGFAEDDSEAELISASQQQERTRQKKFSKFFKELQGEVVNISKQIIFVKTSSKHILQGISCAYVGDILLHGNLYVTENYLAFHSNVFGYVTKVIIIQIISLNNPCTNIDPVTNDHSNKHHQRKDSKNYSKCYCCIYTFRNQSF